MSNRFEVQVVALDKFTAVFRNLNNQASKAVRPITMTARQVTMLGRELHLDKLASGFGKVTNAATMMSRTLGLSLGPLESVLGLGAAGGIIGALGAAGIAATALAVRSASAGFEVRRTAKTIGLTTDGLQRYRGAASLAGVATTDMDESLASFGQTLEDAKFGRNMDAMARWAILMKGAAIPMKDGMIDEATALRMMADKLQQIADPRVQMLIASGFGLDRALPLLREGSDNLRELGDEADNLGLVQGVHALDWSEAFVKSLNRLKGTLTGVANEWGQEFVPTIGKGIDNLNRAIGPDTEKGNKKRSTPFSNMFAVGPINAVYDLLWRRMVSPAEITGPGDRTRSGPIGGAMHSGPLTRADYAAMAASAAGGGGDAGMRAAMNFSPEDAAHAAAVEHADQNIRDIQRELATQRDPGARRALQEELARNQGVKVEVQFKNAPTGTTATARDAAGMYLPTRVHYSMPSETMP